MSKVGFCHIGFSRSGVWSRLAYCDNAPVVWTTSSVTDEHFRTARWSVRWGRSGGRDRRSECWLTGRSGRRSASCPLWDRCLTVTRADGTARRRSIARRRSREMTTEVSAAWSCLTPYCSTCSQPVSVVVMSASLLPTVDFIVASKQLPVSLHILHGSVVDITGYFRRRSSHAASHLTGSKNRSSYHLAGTSNTFKGQIKTAEQRTIIQQYGNWYTGRWWVGCYIWYSEEGPGRAAAPPSPLLAVSNVTAHPSTASVSV